MEPEDVRAVAVIGAGTMGHGIAEVAALAGYDIALRDISEERVQDGYDHIEWSLEKLADGDRITELEADAARDRISPYVRLNDALEDVDLVIEAVPEKLEVKKEVYRELDSLAPADATFVTNTSTFSITELGSTIDRPGRFCGLHFFNPLVQMPLVEVIAGAESSEPTLELVESFAATLGKTPIRVQKDPPGFVVNRVLVPLLNDAAWQVESNFASIAEVDSTTKHQLGLPMGSFELVDQIGIDVIVDVIESMHAELGDGYKPAPPLLEKARSSEVGKKAGVGFYDYRHDGVEIPTDRRRDDVAERLLAVANNEVASLVEAGVATVEEIDQAMTLGAGFPAGPTELGAEFGYARLQQCVADLASTASNPQYKPAPLLERWAERGEPTAESV